MRVGGSSNPSVHCHHPPICTGLTAEPRAGQPRTGEVGPGHSLGLQVGHVLPEKDAAALVLGQAEELRLGEVEFVVVVTEQLGGWSVDRVALEADPNYGLVLACCRVGRRD